MTNSVIALLIPHVEHREPTLLRLPSAVLEQAPDSCFMKVSDSVSLATADLTQGYLRFAVSPPVIRTEDTDEDVQGIYTSPVSSEVNYRSTSLVARLAQPADSQFTVPDTVDSILSVFERTTPAQREGIRTPSLFDNQPDQRLFLLFQSLVFCTDPQSGAPCDLTSEVMYALEDFSGVANPQVLARMKEDPSYDPMQSPIPPTRNS